VIRNVTASWEEERTREGLYIARCLKPDFANRIRIGAGGNKGGTLGIFGRLRDHRKIWRGAAECETHTLQPFETLHAWGLDGWTQEQLNDGERLLWSACLVRYPKHRGNLKDKSIFVVGSDFDPTELILAVTADLHALELINQAPLPGI
jgi:hypothetical protein